MITGLPVVIDRKRRRSVESVHGIAPSAPMMPFSATAAISDSRSGSPSGLAMRVALRGDPVEHAEQHRRHDEGHVHDGEPHDLAVVVAVGVEEYLQQVD